MAMTHKVSPVEKLIGSIPNRVQLAGGWIDQPFVSQHNPNPWGSMVVVQIEPNFRPMDRSGFAGGTREVAMKLWNGVVPARDRSDLVRELYEAENHGRPDPSGSQDMIGLVYPGVNRLDYNYRVHGGVFPSHVVSCEVPHVGRWLETRLHFIPLEPRPPGYDPLGVKNFEPNWIARLGNSGIQCFDAIVRMDLAALGASLTETMKCWEVILPHVVRHPLLRPDLADYVEAYQQEYSGAMFSGCGGGYIIVASEEAVPGAFTVKVRTS
jgi:hypothetical protein